MKKTIVIVLAILCLGFVQDFNPQSKAITDKYFPEPEIEINTPAFKKTKGYTSYNELVAFLTDLQKQHPDEMSIQYIGESQKGKAIPLVKLNRKGNEQKIKVWLQAGLHGDEMASTEGILYLLERILNDQKYSNLLNKLEIAIVPMANIDGYEKEDRYAANGLDLNRDQTKLMIKESVFLKQAFSDFNAEVAVDFHEYRPYRKEYTQLSSYGITSRYDVMFMSSGNLNVPEKLRRFTNENFVNSAKNELDKIGYTHREYLTSEKEMGSIHFNQGSNSARSSATSYALANTISSLIEVRGVGIGRTSFKRRIFTTFTIGMSYLSSAYHQIDEVKEVLNSELIANDLAVVTSKKEITTEPLKVIDLESGNEMNLDVEIRNASKSTAVLTRKRPTAYLIEPSQSNLVEKLSVLGVSHRVLPASISIEVETYAVKQYEKATEKDEGVFQQKVKTEVQTETRILPKGTYIIPMDQENANLVIEVLEPEAPNSFVTFGVLPTFKDANLPIYRYLKNEKIY